MRFIGATVALCLIFVVIGCSEYDYDDPRPKPVVDLCRRLYRVAPNTVQIIQQESQPPNPVTDCIDGTIAPDEFLVAEEWNRVRFEVTSSNGFDLDTQRATEYNYGSRIIFTMKLLEEEPSKIPLLEYRNVTENLGELTSYGFTNIQGEHQPGGILLFAGNFSLLEPGEVYWVELDVLPVRGNYSFEIGFVTSNMIKEMNNNEESIFNQISYLFRRTFLESR